MGAMPIMRMPRGGKVIVELHPALLTDSTTIAPKSSEKIPTTSPTITEGFCPRNAGRRSSVRALYNTRLRFWTAELLLLLLELDCPISKEGHRRSIKRAINSSNGISSDASLPITPVLSLMTMAFLPRTKITISARAPSSLSPSTSTETDKETG